MTKKDYEKIANTINEVRLNIPFLQSGQQFGAAVISRGIAYKLSDMLANDNPRFDRARFLKACGLD